MVTDTLREREVEISATYGQAGTRVAPYAPNRAQRRAQAAAKRKNRSKK